MQTYRVEVAHRETGAADVLYVEALSEQEAATIANDRGWMVGKVTDVPPVVVPGKNDATFVPNLRDRKRTRPPVWIAWVTAGLVAGMLIGFILGRETNLVRRSPSDVGIAPSGSRTLSNADKWQLSAEREKHRRILAEMAGMLQQFRGESDPLVRASIFASASKAREEAARWLDAAEVERILPARQIPEPTR